MLRPPFSTLVLPTLIGLATACSGKTFTTSEESPGDGNGGNAATGGAGSGGNGSGGTASGGAGNGGTGSGGTGTGGLPTFNRDCFSTFDCELRNNTCCGTCDRPSLDNVMAVTTGQDEDISDALCGDGTDCPACEPTPNPNLFAACIAGTCEAIDLRMHEEAACETNDDCVVLPAACCPCEAEVGPGTIVAANRNATTFQEAQCETTPICPPDCTYTPPPGIVPTCENGFCALPPPPDTL